jgi:hypothetical protein
VNREEVKCGDVDKIKLVEDSVHLWAFVKTVMDLEVDQLLKIYLAPGSLLQG